MFGIRKKRLQTKKMESNFCLFATETAVYSEICLSFEKFILRYPEKVTKLLRYLVHCQKNGSLFQIFVAFSDYLNFSYQCSKRCSSPFPINLLEIVPPHCIPVFAGIFQIPQQAGKFPVIRVNRIGIPFYLEIDSKQ